MLNQLNSITTPIHARSRHLYRHLIRQTHIFHDDICRTHISRFLRKRFETPVVNVNQRAHRLKRGIKFLSLLERANAGFYDPLLKVLKLGYGRLGPRWHGLMKPVLAIDPDTPPKPPLVPGKERTIPPTMTEPLVALLNFAKISNITPKNIPALNTWLRPLQPSLKSNLLWRHYTNLVSSCPSPLPEDEWAKLENYAMGTGKPAPPRRRNAEDIKRRLVEKWDGVNREMVGSRYVGRPRNMGERSWRRMWREVLKGSPKLVWDGERKEGKKWSAVGSSLLANRLKDIRMADESVFEGYMPDERRPQEMGKKRPRQEKGTREEGSERDMRDRGKEGNREMWNEGGREKRVEGDRERNKDGEQERKKNGDREKWMERTRNKNPDQDQSKGKAGEDKEIWLNDKAREISNMLGRMQKPPENKPITKDVVKQKEEKRWSINGPGKQFRIDRKRDSEDRGKPPRR